MIVRLAGSADAIMTSKTITDNICMIHAGGNPYRVAMAGTTIGIRLQVGGVLARGPRTVVTRHTLTKGFGMIEVTGGQRRPGDKISMACLTSITARQMSRRLPADRYSWLVATQAISGDSRM